MKQLSVKRFENALALSERLLSFLLLVTGIFIYSEAHAAVTITKAAGGTGISADKAMNATVPAYTLLGNLIVTENAVNDFSTGSGSITLAAPSGWTFNPLSSVSVTK